MANDSNSYKRNENPYNNVVQIQKDVYALYSDDFYELGFTHNEILLITIMVAQRIGIHSNGISLGMINSIKAING